MKDYVFFYENEIYKIFQRTRFSNVFIYNKGKMLRQYVEPGFFVKILESPISDTDVLFLFPWKMDLVIDKSISSYLKEYKNYWFHCYSTDVIKKHCLNC